MAMVMSGAAMSPSYADRLNLSYNRNSTAVYRCRSAGALRDSHNDLINQAYAQQERLGFASPHGTPSQKEMMLNRTATTAMTPRNKEGSFVTPSPTPHSARLMYSTDTLPPAELPSQGLSGAHSEADLATGHSWASYQATPSYPRIATHTDALQCRGYYSGRSLVEPPCNEFDAPQRMLMSARGINNHHVAVANDQLACQRDELRKVAEELEYTVRLSKVHQAGRATHHKSTLAEVDRHRYTADRITSTNTTSLETMERELLAARSELVRLSNENQWLTVKTRTLQKEKGVYGGELRAQRDLSTRMQQRIVDSLRDANNTYCTMSSELSRETAQLAKLRNRLQDMDQKLAGHRRQADGIDHQHARAARRFDEQVGEQRARTDRLEQAGYGLRSSLGLVHRY